MHGVETHGAQEVHAEMSAGTLVAASAGDVLGCAGAPPRPDGAAGGIQYFSRFGVTEALIAEALSAALSRGGDYADVFFQHRVTNDLALEDGAVNRAFATVELGVGVRVVKGDQTGYGYTEDPSPAAPQGLRPDGGGHR